MDRTVVEASLTLGAGWNCYILGAWSGSIELKWKRSAGQLMLMTLNLEERVY